MTHVVAVGMDAEAERPAVVQEVVDFIVRDLFTVDEHPTLSRMFTYRDNLDHMLTMVLLGIPSSCFRLQRIVPRKLNQKRMAHVHRFFKNPDAGQLLRRTCLGLQLAAGVTAMVSHKDRKHELEKARGGDMLAASGDTLPAAGGASLPAAGGGPLPAAGGAQAGDTPLIIKLCLGEELVLMASRRETILNNLRSDPDIDIVAVLGVVLGGEIELSLRFRRYKEFPFALCKRCRRWFRETYVEAIKAFLHVGAADLDRGMALPLQQLALRGRTFAEAVTWLQSKPLQDFLEEYCLRLEATSLPVERKFAQIKKWETSRLVDVQTASENSILQAFSRERELASKEVNDALKEQRRVKYLNARALAVVANPKLNPNLYRVQAAASPGLPAAAPLLASGGGLPAAAVETPKKKRLRRRGPPGSADSLASPAQASPTPLGAGSSSHSFEPFFFRRPRRLSSSSSSDQTPVSKPILHSKGT